VLTTRDALPGHQPRPAKVIRLMAFFLAEYPRLKKPVKKKITKFLVTNTGPFMYDNRSELSSIKPSF